MSEQQNPAASAGDEAVSEAQVSAPEAAESTEGQVETQTAEESQDADGSQEPEAGDDAEKVSRSKQRRERQRAEMDRLRTIEQERDAAVQRREKIKAAAAQSSTPPKWDDYSSNDDYLLAVGAYQASRMMDGRQLAEADEAVTAHEQRYQEAENQRKAALAADWQRDIAEARGRYADFDAVVFSAPISDKLAEMIVEADRSADLAYKIASDHAVAAHLSSLPPLAAARELGKLEAQLSAPRARTTTQAPEPVTPVRPKATASKNWQDMTPDEFAQWRAEGGTIS